MTREKVKELLPVMQAYANGEVIQFCRKTPEPHWVDVQSDDLIEFREDASQYRIKPEPKYRHSKMQKNALRRCKNINLLDG